MIVFLSIEQISSLPKSWLERTAFPVSRLTRWISSALRVLWKRFCWCNHNNNENNITRNWIILLNIISIKKGITQHNFLDWGAALALFKEIQALGWLNFITGADLLWLVSPRIQQPNKCCMAEQPLHKVFKPKAPAERTPFLAKNLSIFFFVCIVCCSNLDWVWMSLFIGSMGLTKLLPNLFWFN